ncbi:hypothetical protein ACFL3V_00510 [Nanoarchaeota archaeon]
MDKKNQDTILKIISCIVICMFLTLQQSYIVDAEIAEGRELDNYIYKNGKWWRQGIYDSEVTDSSLSSELTKQAEQTSPQQPAAAGSSPDSSAGAAPADTNNPKQKKEGSSAAPGSTAAPAAPTAPAKPISFSLDGDIYTRTGPGEYKRGGVTWTVDDRGDEGVFLTPTNGESSKVDAEFAQNIRDAQTKAGPADAKAAEESVRTQKSETGGKKTTPVDPKAAEFKSGFNWPNIANQVYASGGWFNFIFGGAFSSSFYTLGSSWFGEGADSTSDFGMDLTINRWAEDYCDDRHLYDPNLAGSRGFITSPSGRSFAHMEGERVYIDPCLSVLGRYENASCDPYYAYKISGEISAGEGPMEFIIYLDEEIYNIYGTYGEIELEAGEKLSLAGANMFYFETPQVYDTICIKFLNFDQVHAVFGGMFDEEDNPICQTIVAGYEREYQQFADEDGPSLLPTAPIVPTPIITAPGATTGAPGAATTTPGLSP